MEIVVRQISGLGNQLFQYAAGRYYAGRYGAGMRVAIDRPVNAVSHGYPRPFLLSHFCIPVPLRDLTIPDRLVLSTAQWMRPATLAWKAAFGVRVLAESFADRHRFKEDVAVRGARTLYLVGYWQTYRIVEAVASELRQDLSFREPPPGKNLQTLSEIKGCRNAVSLHIRRGDYTLAAEGNIALPIDFYLRAIRTMLERLGDAVFFVFSDDMEFARANLPRDIGMVFVDHNDAGSSHEDLRLMSACAHHIIANSTFSWWGAWLNSKPGKIVIAPRQWHLTPDSYYPDLLPPEWTLLDARTDPGQMSGGHRLANLSDGEPVT